MVCFRRPNEEGHRTAPSRDGTLNEFVFRFVGCHRQESAKIASIVIRRAKPEVLLDQVAPQPDGLLTRQHAPLQTEATVPVPMLQFLARDHPAGGADVRAVPAVAAERRGSAC